MLFHALLPCPDQLSQPCPLGDVDLVRQEVAGMVRAGEGEVVVLDGARKLLGKVLIQRAARGHVDELHATADAEHRLLLDEGPLGKRDLDAIALTVGLVAQRVRIGAVGERVDIRATGKEDRVELVVHAAQGVLVDERDHPWDGPRCGEGEDVPLAHDPRRRNLARDAAEALKGLGRNADDGPAGAM
jgi:hypothetical protein